MFIIILFFYQITREAFASTGNLLRVHNTVKQEAGGGGGGGEVTVLVQGKVVILCQIKLGVNENPPFYQCARVNARANDARNMRSRDAQCKTRESP